MKINDCIIRRVVQIEVQEYSCVSHIVSFFVWCELWMLLFTRYYPAKRVTENGVNSNRNIVQPLKIRPLSLLFFGKKSIL